MSRYKHRRRSSNYLDIRKQKNRIQKIRKLKELRLGTVGVIFLTSGLLEFRHIIYTKRILKKILKKKKKKMIRKLRIRMLKKKKKQSVAVILFKRKIKKRKQRRFKIRRKKRRC